VGHRKPWRASSESSPGRPQVGTAPGDAVHGPGLDLAGHVDLGGTATGRPGDPLSSRPWTRGRTERSGRPRPRDRKAGSSEHETFRAFVDNYGPRLACSISKCDGTGLVLGRQRRRDARLGSRRPGRILRGGNGGGRGPGHPGSRRARNIRSDRADGDNTERGRKLGRGPAPGTYSIASGDEIDVRITAKGPLRDPENAVKRGRRDAVAACSRDLGLESSALHRPSWDRRHYRFYERGRRRGVPGCQARRFNRACRTARRPPKRHRTRPQLRHMRVRAGQRRAWGTSPGSSAPHRTVVRTFSGDYTVSEVTGAHAASPTFPARRSPTRTPGARNNDAGSPPRAFRAGQRGGGGAVRLRVFTPRTGKVVRRNRADYRSPTVTGAARWQADGSPARAHRTDLAGPAGTEQPTSPVLSRRPHSGVGRGRGPGDRLGGPPTGGSPTFLHRPGKKTDRRSRGPGPRRRRAGRTTQSRFNSSGGSAGKRRPATWDGKGLAAPGGLNLPFVASTPAERLARLHPFRARDVRQRRRRFFSAVGQPPSSRVRLSTYSARGAQKTCRAHHRGGRQNTNASRNQAHHRRTPAAARDALPDSLQKDRLIYQNAPTS